MRSNIYQMALIFLGAIATAFLGVFVYREFFPEYRQYQKNYMALEQFRASYTLKPPPDFKEGVKQILLETPDNGPPVIDRCISCHVALDVPYFSPTKLTYDVNGNILLDEKGLPVQVPNEDYIWGKLDQRIAELTDVQVNNQLKAQGEGSIVTARLKEAEQLKALKTITVGEHTYDVTKALAMHPLMGRETRPFEFHPVADYGCTSCHGGNGRALTVDKAHGPVFDEEYAIENRGPKPKFLETDSLNDPRFSQVFNNKPGDELVFQTTPILVGDLVQAKCMQCHQLGSEAILGAFDKTQGVTGRSEEILAAISESYHNGVDALVSLLLLKQKIELWGYNKTLSEMQRQLNQYLVPSEKRSTVESQLRFLMNAVKAHSSENENTQHVLKKIDLELIESLGSPTLVKKLDNELKGNEKNTKEIVEKFISMQQTEPDARGSLFVKANSLELEEALFHHVQDTETSFSAALNDPRTMNAIQTDVDRLTDSYQRGKELYIEQACYACHRISGMARGGIGPELTKIGKNYPWYIKHHIVWPQGDLPTSTMPNYRLDHAELEPLMTFLLAQRGANDSVSKSEYKRLMGEWEAGKKMPWEKPISPTQMYDLHYAMTVFATEGCAACHRLRGFESNVGYRVEKEKKNTLDFETLYREREWFTKLIPEEILGSQLVEILEKQAEEIDAHIVDGVRKGSILEEIQQNYPQDIEGFYTNFRFASRAMDHRTSHETDPQKKKELQEHQDAYKKRLQRVLMMYIQEYGLGRLIGPRPNWSGIYRTDAWLMEHFKNPGAHVARSIMPVFPFDDTKFYALTHMLDVLSQRNIARDRQIWDFRGFNPALAYQLYCSQCHGEYLGGNGPVSPWIYPVPKNLRNAEFLRNYTKERVNASIMHGVKGTPMPPLGEVAQDKLMKGQELPVLTTAEISQLTDWLFSTLPGGTIIQHPEDVPKWNYQPEDVLKELQEEGHQLEKVNKIPHDPLGLLNWERILPNGQSYIVSAGVFVPHGTDKEKQTQVNEYFDIIKNPPGSPDQNSYFIKREFYTPENIQSGKVFFDVYCAVCHGAEADGSGARAAVMQEAKPRMLTNLDWLETHDDLYLLRSIKYGVPGTSMTPWGDQTTSLLRMQLVMFIRSLTDDAKNYQMQNEILYQAFDAADYQIDTARVNQIHTIETLEKQFNQVKDQQQQLFKETVLQSEKQKEAVAAYEKQLSLSEQIQIEKNKDRLLVQVKEMLAKEKKIYKDLGSTLLANKMDGKIPDLFLESVGLLDGRFTIIDQHLVVKDSGEMEQKIHDLKGKIVNEINQKIALLNESRTQAQAQIQSFNRDQTIKEIDSQIKSLNDYKEKIEIGFQEAQQLRQKQIRLIQQFNQETAQPQKKNDKI